MMFQTILSYKSNLIQNSCPFYGQSFKVRIQITSEYPKEKDCTQFRVERPDLFYHPNIDAYDGSVCSTTISAPMIDIRARMRAFMFLLSAPNPHSCLNGKAGSLYLQNSHTYYKKAVKIYRGLLKQTQ